MLQKLVNLLFASGTPLTFKECATLCEVSIDEVKATIPELQTYIQTGGLSLLVSDTEMQIVTGNAYSALATSLLKKDLEGELTPATLQVLTIIAYLGKVSRNDISFIRGVQSSQSIRTLSVRGLITRDGDMCELTLDALRYLGIAKKEELPDYETLHKDLVSKLQEAKEM
jgi:segregation and condensation protein B